MVCERMKDRVRVRVRATRTIFPPFYMVTYCKYVSYVVCDRSVTSGQSRLVVLKVMCTSEQLLSTVYIRIYMLENVTSPVLINTSQDCGIIINSSSESKIAGPPIDLESQTLGETANPLGRRNC